MTVSRPRRKLSDSADIGIQYNCDGCHANITKIVRIQCAECRDVDLCVECFSEGVENIGRANEHKKEHSYCVIEPFHFPILVDDWRADEELLLLEGCLTVGLGNWVDIAEYIGTKTAKECEEHYTKLYLESTNFPIPDEHYWIKEKRHLEIGKDPAKLKEPPIEVLASHPAQHEVQGFMPLRLEFEQEPDNELESLVKDLQFLPEDSLLEKEMKIGLLEYYNDVLDRRVEKKKFILNYDLLRDFKSVLAHEKARQANLSKEEKELIVRCASVAGRFLCKEDYEEFLGGVLEEERLKKRIKVLQEYRRQGIRDFETAKNYDKELLSKAQLSSSVSNLPSAASDEASLTTIIRPSTLDTADGRSYTGAALPPKPAVATRRFISVPLDITDAEGFELLNPSERNLCSVLRLLPKTYLNVKETLIAAYYKHGYLKRAQARSMIKIDVNKTSRIYDFFVTAGWVHPEPKKAIDE